MQYRQFYLHRPLFNASTVFTAHGYTIYGFISRIDTFWTRADFEPREVYYNRIRHAFYGNWASTVYNFQYVPIPQNARVQLSFNTPNTAKYYATPFSIATGTAGFIETCLKFSEYISEMENLPNSQPFGDWAAKLHIIWSIPVNPMPTRLLFGSRKDRMQEIYDKYVVFDEPSKKSCIWKSLYKGKNILQSKPNAITQKGTKLTNKTSRFKYKVISKNYVTKENENDADSVISGVLKYWEDVFKISLKVVLLDFHFKEIKEYGSLKAGLRGTFYIRDNGRNHAQLVVLRSLLENLRLVDLDTLDTENKLYRSKVKETDEMLYWVGGEKSFSFRGKEYKKASLNEMLYRMGVIVTEHTKILKRKDVKLEKLGTIGSFDLETIPEYNSTQQSAIISGLYYIVNGEKIYCQFVGEDCIERMFDWMRERSHQLNGRTIYAHNGGKFDYFLLFKTLFNIPDSYWKLEPKSVFIICGRISAFTIKHQGIEVHFKDSSRMIASSLDGAANGFGTATKKLSGFDVVEALQNRDDPQIMQEILKYHFNDIECLYQVMEIFQDRFFKASDYDENGYGMDATEFMTSSQAAINVFCQKCLPKYPNLYTPPPILDRLLRHFFSGGRCEVQRLGSIHSIEKDSKFLFWDINSLYPFEMQKPLPYGIAKILKPDQFGSYVLKEVNRDADILDESFFGFVHAKVWQEDYERWKKYPQCLEYHNGTLLMFPFFDEPVEMIIFAPVIAHLQRCGIGGYHFKILNLIQYEAKCFLKDHVQKLQKVKAEASLRDDVAMRNTAKTLSNSTFGCFSINPDRECVEFLDQSQSYVTDQAFADGSLKEINICGDTILLKKEEIINTRCSSVGVSSAITAYSRLEQWSNICEVIENGHDFILGDTDSMCFRVNGSMKDFRNSSLYNKVIGGQQEILGKEKDEMFSCAKKLFKNNLAPLVEYLAKYELTLEDELLPFDKCCVAAAKGYYCKATIGDKIINKKALKGANFEQHRKLTGEDVNFETFEQKLIEEKNLVLQQLVFKSGIPSMFSKDTPFGVSVEETVKEFKVIYNKGRIEELFDNYYLIEPWKISEIKEKDKALQLFPIQKTLEQFY